MNYRIAFPMFAFLATAGCQGGGVTSPTSREATLSASADRSSSNESVARSGDFTATKECSTYGGAAGQFCTITSSNLKEIPVGTRVTYLSALGANGRLDSRIVLDPPGPGNNQAFGHVVLSYVPPIGQVWLDGGTGKFQHIQANVAVTHLTGRNWLWHGSYSYSK